MTLSSILEMPAPEMPLPAPAAKDRPFGSTARKAIGDPCGKGSLAESNGGSTVAPFLPPFAALPENSRPFGGFDGFDSRAGMISGGALGTSGPAGRVTGGPIGTEPGPLGAGAGLCGAGVGAVGARVGALDTTVGALGARALAAWRLADLRALPRRLSHNAQQTQPTKNRKAAAIGPQFISSSREIPKLPIKLPSAMAAGTDATSIACILKWYS
ncbi:MAG: hypothetical protein FWE94_00530 [Coriobacteriia bacterium]|nr:hypothetical protein [Coriobacteriia bacterium]